MLHLRKDQRVTDFCGDNIAPGYFITRDKRPGENWVKFEFKIKGGSGTLQAKVIGDNITHLDLTELAQEKKEFNAKMATIKDPESPEAKKLKTDYVPVDFDAYSIMEKDFQASKDPLNPKERIWRISSLVASVDSETRILLLPTP